MDSFKEIIYFICSFKLNPSDEIFKEDSINTIRELTE
jgi:hypothetical protein